MTLQEYLKFIDGTIKNDNCRSLWYLGLGLGGESGEVLNEIKKMYRDAEKPETRKNLKLELGDVAWYFFQLCKALKFDPEEIFEANAAKLTKRMKDQENDGKRKDK